MVEQITKRQGPFWIDEQVIRIAGHMSCGGCAHLKIYSEMVMGLGAGQELVCEHDDMPEDQAGLESLETPSTCPFMQAPTAEQETE